MADYTHFIKSNVAPYAASKIGVYKDGTRVGSISLGNFKPNYGERLYRFGVLSDVHNQSDQSTENWADLKNALTYFQEKESIEFTVICGDLSQNGTTTEWQYYKDNVAEASPTTPVYATTGNHDAQSGINIATFYDYAGAAGVTAPASDAEYSFEVTKTHQTSAGKTVTDHFLFFSMKQWEFTTNTYSSTDITWLNNKLTAYKDDRCFVITHMFIPTYAGNLNDIYPSGNWLSSTMLTQVKNLVDSHTNAIWFSGHSHWKWYLQKYQDRANIYPLSNASRNIAWNVHIPSCASPIDSDGTTRVSMGEQSEGAIVDVYEDRIVVRGVTFKDAGDTGYVTRYLPIAQFMLMNEPGASGSGGGESSGSGQTDTNGNSIFKASYNNWALNPNKTNSGDTLSDDITVEESGSNTITSIKFDAHTEGFYFTSEHLTNGGTINLMWDSVQFENPEGTVLSYTPEHFGWYDGTDTSTSNNKGYSLASPFSTTTTTLVTSNGYYGVQFNTSSTIATQNTSLSISSGLVVRFTNLRYSIEGCTATTDSGNNMYGASGGSSGGGGGDTPSTAKTTLAVKANAASAGIGIATNQTSSKLSYVKYDDIKFTDANGNDVTSTVTSTSTGSSNSYKVGVYTSASTYAYATAGTSFPVSNNTANTSTYVLPLVQASSSSSVATSPVYVQLKGIKWSMDGSTWNDFNSEQGTIVNGSDWGKSDLTYVWIDDIVSDPTTLSYSS